MACGLTPAGELARAAASLEWAETTAIIERHRAGRRWFDGLRFCTEDDELKFAVKLFAAELFRPEIEGLIRQVGDLKAQVADLEDEITGRAAA